MNVESPEAFPESELRHNGALTQGAWGSATDYLFRIDSPWEHDFEGLLFLLFFAATLQAPGVPPWCRGFFC